MRIDIVSLFPEFFDAFFSHSIIKRAIEAERLSMGVTNPRDFSHNKHGQVDDTPYGGGAGMLMMAPPIFEAVESVISQYDSHINSTIIVRGNRFYGLKNRRRHHEHACPTTIRCIIHLSMFIMTKIARIRHSHI